MRGIFFLTPLIIRHYYTCEVASGSGNISHTRYLKNLMAPVILLNCLHRKGFTSLQPQSDCHACLPTCLPACLPVHTASTRYCTSRDLYLSEAEKRAWGHQYYLLACTRSSYNLKILWSFWRLSWQKKIPELGVGHFA